MIGFEEWHWPPSQIQSIAITLILSTIILKQKWTLFIVLGFYHCLYGNEAHDFRKIHGYQVEIQRPNSADDKSK